MKHLLIIIAALALAAGCKDDKAAEKAAPKTTEKKAEEKKAEPEKKTEEPKAEPEKQAKPEEKKEDKIVTTDSGLKIETLKEGTGDSPKQGQTVVVHYTGWLTNGKKFDSSVDRGQPFKFPLGMRKVIKGWDEGVALMKVGQKVKLTIPANLGYGPRGFPPVIPPDSTLIFEVELLGLE